MNKIPAIKDIIHYQLDHPGNILDAVSAKTIGIGNKPNLDYGTRADFAPSEFNLSEIGIIEDVEGYVRQAFQKKTALMFKEGEEITGKNRQVIRYLKKRIRQIEKITGIPWRSLLRETGHYLISRSNFFWVIVRDLEKSGGKRIDGQDPVAGFFPIPPETMQVKKDQKTGRILKYRQLMPDGRTKEFSPKNIIHFTAYRKSGFLFGTPAIVPVKDDIRALRRIEENIELLIYQNLFPIFHYKVGTEQKPAGQVRLPDGTVVDEVDYVKSTIQALPSEGGLVTPERHEIDFIGAEGKGIRAEGYLDYFKKRVFAGLGVSSVDFGDGETANRATADNMSRVMVDSVKDYQDILAEQLNHFVFRPLLLESTFNLDFFDDDNLAEFRFKEIDIETQLKKNVNAQLLYNGNLWDVNEARDMTGAEPLESSQEKDMFSKRVTIPEVKIKTGSQELIAEMNIEAQQQAVQASTIANAHIKAGTTTTKTSKTATGGTSKSVTKVNKAVAGRIKAMSAPANQHGTKTGPQKSLKDYAEMDSLATTRWRQIKEDILEHVDKGKNLDVIWVETLINLGLADLRDRYLDILQRDIFKGAKEFNTILPEELFNLGKELFVVSISSYINNLSKVLTRRVNASLQFNSEEDKRLIKTRVMELFDSMEFRLRFFDRTEKDRAFNLGKALALKSQGRSLIKVHMDNDKCETCMDAEQLVDLDPIILDSLPPNHSNCSCGVVSSDFTSKEERCILSVKRQLRAKNPSWNKQRITSAAIAICRSSGKKD